MPVLDSHDLRFLLFDWLKIDGLLERPRFADHPREVIASLLDLSAELAENEFLAHHKKSDQVEPVLVDGEVRVLPEVGAGVRAFVEAGFLAGPLPADVGGLQLPYVVHSAAMAHFFAANTGTAAYPMLTVANANLLAEFASEAQIDAFLKPQLDGRALGTMCLSEPQAGSSLGDIMTRAEPDGEDVYGQRFRLTGNKMWSSAGDHAVTPNIMHLVLAKEPGPDGRLTPGPKGISLFLTPKVLLDGQRNDVAVAGLNHKMGYRGTSNCLLNFGEGATYRPDGRAGAVGYRIGGAGQGLAIMFRMMNEARIGVGLGAAAISYRSYLHALKYARERLQGRLQDAKDPTAPQVALIHHPDVRLMLLAQKAYAEGGLALTLYCAALIDEAVSAPSSQERSDAEILLGLLTPVAKTWPSEWGLAGNDLAIQVHGGYGYTRDFDVEQLYRENRLNAIHEGTTGIQAIDLLNRKILKDRDDAIGRLSRRIEAELTRAPAALSEDAAAVLAAWREVHDLALQLRERNDVGRAMWNATPFLRAFGHVVVAWIWIDQAQAALRLDPDAREPFTQGKLGACHYFVRYELPKMDAWLGVVRDGESVAALLPEEAF
jgi:alkylation response protein AidB-like acyl-CoA dehydrogenase